MSLSSAASVLRAGRYSYRGFLATPPETPVLYGALSGLSPTPSLTLAYTTTGGSSANVKPGMLVRVFDSTGKRKGILRVATGGSITSTSLPVNEFSATAVNIASGDTFIAYKVWRIWDKLVSADSSFNKDSRIVFAGQTGNPPTTATGGGPRIKWIMNTGDVASFNFSDDNDHTNDPTNIGNDLDFAWDLADSTYDGATNTQTLTGVTFPEGYRQVAKTVTDGVNGESTTIYLDVWVFGPNYRPIEVIPTSRRFSYDEDQGQGDWAFSFEVVDTAGQDVLARGAKGVYFEREFYGDTEISYGPAPDDQNNIKCVGFLKHEDIEITPDTSTLAFDLVSPLAILADTPALNQLGISAASPAKWSEIKSLSIRRFLNYLLYWHTTVGDSIDVVFVDGLDFTFGRLSVENIDNVAGQLRDIALSLCVDLTCDMRGRILFVRNPDYLTETQRAARTTDYTFTVDDLMRLRVPIEYRGSVKTATSSGFFFNSTITYFAISGDAPWSFGTGVADLPRQIYLDKADALSRVGKHFARVNGLYNGEFVTRAAEVDLPDGYDGFDPALRQYTSLDIDASTNLREWEATPAERYLIDQMDISYDAENGLKDISGTVSHETDGADGIRDKSHDKDGQTGISITNPGFDSFNPGNIGAIPIPYDPSPPVTSPPTGKLFGVEIQFNGAFATINNGVTWFKVGASVITGLMHDACSDPYSYGRKFVITADGLWRIDDPYGAPTVASAVASEDVITGTANVWPCQIEMSINRKGYMACPFGRTSFAYSPNYGATWSQTNMEGGSPETGNQGTFAPGPHGLQPSIEISQWNNPSASNQGWIWGLAPHDAGGGHIKMRAYLSKNWGASWSVIHTTVDDIFGGGLEIPYYRSDGTPNKNDTNQYVLLYGSDGSIHKITAAGVVTTVLVHGTSPNVRFRSSGFYGLTSFTTDGALLASASAGGGAIPGIPYFSPSDDGGASFTDHSYGAGSNGSYPGVNGWGGDPNILLFWTGGYIGTTLDRGVTQSSLYGNLSTLYGGGINPLWVTFDLSDLIPAS